MSPRRWAPLRRSAEIATVRSEGRRASDGSVTVWARPSPTTSRAALSVPVRGITHVDRNRSRRRLRDLLDQALPDHGWDVVVGLRSGSNPSYAELRDSLGRALDRALGAARGTGPGVG